jgi:hypothetical protein
LVYVEAVTPGDVVDDVKGTWAVSVTAAPPNRRGPDTCIVPALGGVNTIVASPLPSVVPDWLLGMTVVPPTFTVRVVEAWNPVAKTTTGVVPTGPLLGYGSLISG